MNEEYDWDIHEVFQEQLELQLPHIKQHISNLTDSTLVLTSLDELFRYFHTYKATSAYLNLTPLYDLVCKVETVLSTLREEKEVVQDSIIEWLFQIEEMMYIYSNEMSLKLKKLSEVPQYIMDKVQITSSYIKPKDKLKSLCVLYMDRNIDRAKKIVPFFKKHVKSVTFSREDKENFVLNLKPYDILIINLNKDNHQIINFTKENFPDLPIIAIFNKISAVCSKELLNNGISHAIENPLSAKVLERELLSIVKVFHSSSKLIIEHKKIHSFIQTLQPLPNTIFQIMQICDDDEIPVKELIKVVKTDPIISANILKVANSPIYGSIELKTIDQAVTKFGKRAIKALTMSGVYNSLGSIDLSAYKIDEEIFSTTSMSRLSLMLKWYSKISIADLSLLSSTALLGNIGQLLISKELVSLDKDDRFQELSSAFDITYAEESILHTSTTQISSQILRFWKLSPEIVDIIEHSDNPKDASSDLRKLCVANHIVNRLISLKGKVAKEIPDDLLPLLAEFNFNPAVLTKALESLKA